MIYGLRSPLLEPEDWPQSTNPQHCSLMSSKGLPEWSIFLQQAFSYSNSAYLVIQTCFHGKEKISMMKESRIVETKPAGINAKSQR